MFGMGTGVSLAPWAPILAFVLLFAVYSGEASNTIRKLLENYFVSNAAFFNQRTAEYASFKTRYFRVVSLSTKPKTKLELRT